MGAETEVGGGFGDVFRQVARHPRARNAVAVVSPADAVGDGLGVDLTAEPHHVTNRREPILTLRSSPESINSYSFVRPMPRRAITAGTAISSAIAFLL